MRYFFPLLLLLAVQSLLAQSINGIPLSSIDVPYVELEVRSRLMGDGVTIRLDFGQELESLRANQLRIEDEQGQAVVLNSIVDALNFMHANGYELVLAYSDQGGNSSAQHFLLRRME